ncbi:hypothetical protein C8R45DRAFT_1095627 [Mycena sanguinolenta]|nr:hypothetical protein C8R45DRAFT_1095627 [Mycena sanguinolenta]
MPQDQLDDFQMLRDFSGSRSQTPETGASNTPNVISMHDVLDGSTTLEMSHGGGKFLAALQEEIEEAVSPAKKKSSPDYRVRDDRTQNLVNGWRVQMDRLVEAYMAWCVEADLGPPTERTVTTLDLPMAPVSIWTF